MSPNGAEGNVNPRLHRLPPPTHLDFDKNRLAQYREQVVGCAPFAAFVRYEVLTSLLAGIPGALGHLLRGRLYGCFLRRFGGRSTIAKGVTLLGTDRIEIGADVGIDEYVRLQVRPVAAGITIGDHVRIGHFTTLHAGDASTASISIGAGSHLNCYVYINALGRVSIGENVLLAPGVVVNSGWHEYARRDVLVKQQPCRAIDIEIEDDVYLAAGARVLDGAHIGRGAVIGAGVTVQSYVEPYSVMIGNPAVRLGERR